MTIGTILDCCDSLLQVALARTIHRVAKIKKTGEGLNKEDNDVE